MKLHLKSVIPVATGAVAVGVGIALLSSTGFAPNNGVDNAWMMLNTSRAGQSLIQLSQASNGGVSGGGNTDPSSLTGILTGLLDGLIGNLTSAVNNGFQDLQGQLVGNVARAVGLKDAYLLYISHACEGDFYNCNDTNSLVKVTKCYSYRDRFEGKSLRRISRSIPDSFVVGTTNVSVPLVSVLGNTLGSLVDLATSGSNLVQAMLIIGVVCTGVVMLGSLVFVVILQRRPLAVAYLTLSLLGATAFYAFAIAGTAVVYGGAGLLNSGGTALGVQARAGSRFVAMAWVAAVFAGVPALHWWAVWFVEFRRHAYRKRPRTPEQVGNWRGIVGEVREDRRVHPLPPVSKEEAAEVAPGNSSLRERRPGVV
ncbi:hypothetical protein RB594_008455 [Gaeumannomyces avenae]